MQTKTTKQATGLRDMNPQTNSPLFKLPREIRDVIYKEAVGGYKVMVDDEEDSLPVCIGIILASKQTYTETIELYYRTTHFEFEDLDVGIAWLAAVPKKRRDLMTDVKYNVALEDVDPEILESGHRMHSNTVDRELIRPVVDGLKAGGVVMRKGVLSTGVH
ncbi:hypothetical protein LTR37_003261 [Vermiconidia calcicola]|uniref:Uncharacterized protein n=1 Tax=Vermiconidia calcicola TaxID=1690605 RepID=A0ACC3NSD3_9PEZI|nr:hypothetical protein LTR37_003261 [Vermiconidia calcicola]